MQLLLLQKVLLRVQSQFTVQSKRLWALGAMVRVFAEVAALVLDQIVGLGKGSVAIGALVRLLAGVRSQMALKERIDFLFIFYFNHSTLKYVY